MAPGDELIVVDSGSTDDLGFQLAAIAPTATLIDAGCNLGFAGGANLGAAAAQGQLIVLLNPDAVVQPGWATALRAAWGSGWDAWMALITMGTGDTINTSGGMLHFCGIGWAGQAGRRVGESPDQPASVAFVSGACLAVPADVWREAGGFPDWYFMYCEDVDLSLRIRLQGGAVGLTPAARVVHDYTFDKGPSKWRLLERNRWATLLRCYPTLVLVVIAPALLVVELAVWVMAARQGWLRMKAQAAADVVRALPRLMRERRQIQAGRRIDALRFAEPLTAKLDSPYLGEYADSLVEHGSRAYWSLALHLLKLLSRDRRHQPAADHNMYVQR